MIIDREKYRELMRRALKILVYNDYIQSDDILTTFDFIDGNKIELKVDGIDWDDFVIDEEVLENFDEKFTEYADWQFELHRDDYVPKEEKED